MSILLGVDDGTISDNTSTTWSTNKIGGKSDWMWPGCKAPTCSACGWTMRLVIQSYCPLESSAYHRTLYVFACVNKPCWNTSHSWQVLRSQVVSEESRKVTSKSPVTIVDDWGTQMDDWGDGTAADNSYCVSPADNASFDQSTSRHAERGDNPKSQSSVVHSRLVAGAVSLNISPPVVDDSPEIEMKQLNIEDSDDESQTSCTVVESDDFLPKKETVESVWKLLSHQNPNDGSDLKQQPCHMLASYYISVIDEPEENNDEPIHVQRLLHEYHQVDNVDLDSMMAVSERKKGGSEGYERGMVHHCDKTFYKFSKRLSRYSKQCIRYEWSGSPLFISTPSAELLDPVRTACSYCGGYKVYELQLMPALIHQLHYLALEEPAVEFGTVLVFTCSKSCWEDGDGVRIETVILQTDPDAHLFKR